MGPTRRTFLAAFIPAAVAAGAAVHVSRIRRSAKSISSDSFGAAAKARVSSGT